MDTESGSFHRAGHRARHDRRMNSSFNAARGPSESLPQPEQVFGVTCLQVVIRRQRQLSGHSRAIYNIHTRRQPISLCVVLAELVSQFRC
jgi:hypothetical protein